MRTVQLSLAVLAALALTGCLDDHSGPEDQWLNTDAYVAPEGGVRDAGTQPQGCTDAGPSFAAPVQVSTDPGADAGPGPTVAQSDVALVATDSGARLVAWVARSLMELGAARLHVAPVSATAAPGADVVPPSPAACGALVQPALGVTGAGTVVLAAICVGGTEQAPTSTDILLYRSTDGGATFGDASTVVQCPAEAWRCAHPTLAASGATVHLAWADEDLVAGVVSAGRVLMLTSTDDGVTFAPDGRRVPDAFADVAAPRLIYDAAGALHVAYAGLSSIGGTSYAAYSGLAGGATDFAEAQNLGPGATPDLLATADAVLVAWAAGGYVMESHASVGGAFSPPLPVDMSLGATAVLGPALTQTERGVHVLWLAEVEGTWRTVYTGSGDLATWSAPVTVAGPFDGSADGSLNPLHRLGQPALAAGSAGVLAAWADPGTTDPVTNASNVFVAELACP
ncbi:MAG TPA: sialidase family protein [Polyangia bacterium]